jgi:hypothetical protein
MLTRRTFLGAAGAALLAPHIHAVDPVKKKLAVVTNVWTSGSHAWHMAERFLHGYGFVKRFGASSSKSECLSCRVDVTGSPQFRFGLLVALTVHGTAITSSSTEPPIPVVTSTKSNALHHGPLNRSRLAATMPLISITPNSPSLDLASLISESKSTPRKSKQCSRNGICPCRSPLSPMTARYPPMFASGSVSGHGMNRLRNLRDDEYSH